MIKTWKHKGLKAFYLTGSKSGIIPSHSEKLKFILGLLDAAASEKDADFPGSKFHKLTADLKGFCSVSVSGNWRVTFRFEGKDVYDVNYKDYH